MSREEAIHALKALLEAGREARIEIQGTSMEPFLRAGDLVLVQAVRPSELKLGDLIAFLQDGNLIVHRYLGRVKQAGSRFLRQKGDHLTGHGLVHPEALIGRVVCAERGPEKRFFLHGLNLAWNRLIGAWTWSICMARERAGWVKRRFRSDDKKALLKNSAGGTNPSSEQEILILAARLGLTPAQEARFQALLKESPQWTTLLEQGSHFGLLPLLHHHFSRPSLSALVPEEAMAKLAKAYHRTSLKNLRMLGLLKRFLVKAEEAGVEVILLKGAVLARCVYGDVGLRPMSDLDLLCHKEDEPAIRTIIEGMGGFRANLPTDRNPVLNHTRVGVMEKIAHSTPWWFSDICRIEVHYHLLSQATVDDAWLVEALWSKAVVSDWDGLKVLSLAPEYQTIHLASHLQHHLKTEQTFSLYWISDILEVLILYRDTLDRRALKTQADHLGLGRDCSKVFRLIGEPWGEEPGLDDQASKREIAILMGMALLAATSSNKRTLHGYLSMIWAVRHVNGFLDKMAYLKDLILPSAWKLAREYRTTSRWILPFLYLVHPFIRVFQGLRGTIHHVQRRLGY